MKSIIENNEQGKANKYPCLKEINDQEGKTVVLFGAPKTGVVVYTTRKYHTLGEYSDFWGEDYYFTPFNGIVELSND